MKRSPEYKVRQIRGGLGWGEPTIEIILSEKKVKELGYWSDRLEKTGRDDFPGSNKITYVTRIEGRRAGYL